jgi:hypothetical protein
MKAWWKQDWVLSVLLILALAWIGYGFLWCQGEIVYSPHSDVIAQGLGVKTVLYKAVHEGRGIPFWREDQFSGYPALTNPQSLYTYPLHILFYFLEPADAVGGTFWLQIVAAALIFYAVGAVLGLGRWAKLLMSVSAMFNYKLILAVHTGWLPFIPGMISFPLLFAAAFYVVNQGGLKSYLAFGFSVALCLHTGHLQLVYYASWFVGLYLLATYVKWWRTGKWETLRRVTLGLLWSTVLGAGMVAYLLVPLANDASLITRAETSYAGIVSDHAITFHQLLTFLHPAATGNPLQPTKWEDVAYFGLLQLILATLGAVLGWRRNSNTRFLVISFVISIIAAMDTPLLRLFYKWGIHLTQVSPRCCVFLDYLPVRQWSSHDSLFHETIE